MENKTDSGKDLLLSYIGIGPFYEKGNLMYITGMEDASAGNVGTVDTPLHARGVNIDPHSDKDPVLFSYLYTKGGQSSLRQLLAKLNAPAQDPARFSVLVPDAGGNWVTQTADVTLIDSDSETVAAINPHGLAQYGSFLYMVDYESAKIILVNSGDLEAAADNATVRVKTFDMNEEVEFIIAGRGQAVVIVGENLYALFIDADELASQFDVSYLFRLSIDGATGDLTLDAQTTVGKNAQSIIPVNDGTNVQLLIPAIGGSQSLTGATNGTDSNICVVPATGAWTSPAPVKITGDPTATPPTAYDIHAVAAAMRDGSSALIILTQIYTTDAVTADGAPWRLYRTTVTDFLDLPPGVTLSSASTVPNAPLTIVDGGTAIGGNFMGYIAYGVSMWDLLYEQVPGNDDEGDRLWAALGTPILATRAGLDEYEENPGYGSPTALFKNPYVMFGHLGGENVNMGAFDLLIETQNQATRGVSLKRNFRKATAPKPTDEDIKAAQAKAATAAAAKNK
jgi:hypothetical protein